MKKIPVIAYFFVAFMLIVGALVLLIEQQKESPLGSQKKVLQVLSYSAFMSEWGAGPLLAKEFEEETGIQIQWMDAGTAGQIIERLQKSSRPIDSVVGIDLISVLEAQKNFQWKKLNRYNTYFSRDLPSSMIFDYFLPIDWSPMTFIFKKKGLPPQRLDDLLKPEFANSLGLQDPNLSSTGLYFLTWILAVRGYEDGFQFIKNLKSSIRVVSPSWSASYGLFQNDLTPMVFSFFTSPLYHHLNEKDFRYQPIYFDEPLIYSVEYMAIPHSCQNCEEAQLWVEFLLRMNSQRIIMEKNFMLPAVEGIRRGTAFDFSKSIQLIKSNDYLKIINDKAKILEQWNQLGM